MYYTKVICIGDSGVGKTSIMYRLAYGAFHEDVECTIGIDLATVLYAHPDRPHICLKLWDTAGQERFRTITQTFYRRADGVIIAFDLSELESFNQIETWVESVAKHANTNIIKILVGNKCDMPEDQRQVTYQ